MAQQVRVDRSLDFKSAAPIREYVQNKSGGALALGDVVVLDLTNSDFANKIVAVTTTTSQDNLDVYGMVDVGMADGDFGWVLREGATVSLKVDGTTDIAAGDELSTFTTVKIAAKATAGKGGAFATALEAYTTNDSNGVLDAILFRRPGVDSTAGGNTLDAAYDQGGAGAGRAITVVDGAITMTKNDAGTENVLEISASPSGAAAGDGIKVTCGGNSTGAGISFANTGSGADVSGTAGWNVTKAGVGTFDSASIGKIALVADVLGTGAAMIGNDNAGDVTINALTGKQVHLAVNDADVVDVAGAAITLAQATTVSTGGLTVSAGGIAVTLGGLTVDAGGATVTAGGLTVSADGATITGTSSITGNTTITGDLTVSGALSFGGNWTIAATLTVDELILGSAGSAPDGTTYNYVVYDNAGDLTANAQSGKMINLAINDVDEYNFGAADVDLLGNHLDNAGYLILNEVTKPAATECYVARDNTGDLNVHALTGKSVHIGIAGADELSITDGACVFNEASNDRDLRFEGNGAAYLFYMDGGKDCIVLGANTDVSSTDHLVDIDRAARTATANTDYADLWVQPTGAVTVPAGTTAVAASVYLAEPNLTATGTVTSAATLYIASAPDEGGTNNNALHIASGSSLLQAVTCAAITASGAATLNAGVIVDTAADPVTLKLMGAVDGYNNDITDVGANEVISLQGVTNAVNELTVTNSIATASVDIGVSGDDANITLGLATKGTGQFDFVAGTAGTAAAPEIILQGDVNSGLYQPAADKLAVSIAGTAVQAWQAGNMLLNDVTSDANTGAGVFILVNAGTPPTGSQTDGVVLYAADVTASSELRVRDEATNDSVLSPHVFELFDAPDKMAWSYYSTNERVGEKINVDMYGAIKAIEELSGKKFIYRAPFN